MYRFFLAQRYLMSRPINLLGMAGVMVGVWALIVVVSIFSGFLKEVRAHIRSATSDLTVLALPSPCSYADVEAVIRSDPNVASCAPRLIWYGLLHAFGKTPENPRKARLPDEPGAESPFVSLIGIDPAAERQVTGFRDWLVGLENQHLRVDDLDAPLRSVGERPAILLSERRLRDEFVEKGAVIKVTSARLKTEGAGKALDPRDAYPGLSFMDREFALAGAYATRHHAFDTAYCFVHIDRLRSMMEAGVDDPVTEVLVRCVDPSLSEETALRLERAVSASLEQPVRAGTWEWLNEPILSAVDHQRSLMKLVLFVIMVVAGFLMYATLSMMVTEKTHDIGILTAMGATAKGVMVVFMSCGLAIVVIGSVLGTIVGCLSSLYLDGFNRWIRATFDVDLFPTRIYNLERVPYDLDPLWIVQVVLVALVLGVLVSGLPAWRAARHNPLDSLRNE